MRLTFLLILASTLWANAATWYVRPGVFTSYGATNPIPTVGVYGTQDGTSYANAWNGITSVVWGASGVNTGDTLYLCGTHIYKRIAGEPLNNGASARNYITVSGITIRGDYATDPGTFFGGAENNLFSWSGPDTDGVYRRNYNGSSVNAATFEISNGTNITRLPTLTSNALKVASSGTYNQGTTNYVKLLQGAPAVTNVALESTGWNFHLNGQSNLTWQAISFVASQGVVGGDGGIIWSTPDYAGGFIAEKSLTFTSCLFRDGSYFYPLPGQDNWTFSGCSFYRTTAGVYSLLNSQTRGAWGITITNCFFSDIGTTEYPDADSTAIGIQGGCNWNIVNNTVTNSGAAIAAWTGGQLMTNLLFQSNFVINASQGGIAVSGLNASAVPGHRVGIRILNNVVVNSAGGSISSNNQDPMDVLNNTIIGPDKGIDMEVPLNFLQGRVYNNIISNPTNYYLYLSGTASNLTYGNNLFYPTLNTTNDAKFCCVFGDNKGASNVLANPGLSNSVPVSFSQAGPAAGSAAIDKGANVGLPFVGSAPDIGAIEWTAQAAVATILQATLLRVGTIR